MESLFLLQGKDAEEMGVALGPFLLLELVYACFNWNHWFVSSNLDVTWDAIVKGYSILVTVI